MADSQKRPYDPEDDGQPHNSNNRYDNSSSELSNMPSKRSNVDIHDPMSLWILLLMVAVVLRILVSTTLYLPQGSSVYNAANTFSNFLLTPPGIAVLPIIIGVIIGSEVGARSRTISSAIKSGLTNGIYASIIYLFTIVIIYIILNAVAPSAAFSFYMTLLSSVLLPILVFMLTLEVFAALSYSRKVDN